VIRSSSGVPVWPDEPAGGRPDRRWVPAGLVALVMSVTVLGGFVTAETLPRPEVRPVSLGGVLTIRPLPGWEVVRREQATVPLPSGGVISAQMERIMLPSGLEAVRFGYIGSEPQSGAAVEGSVTVAVVPSGNGAVFDGWAFQGQLELISEELTSMIDRAEVV
jgi:hypothetical protein